MSAGAGRQRWRFPTGHSGVSQPAVGNGVVCVASGSTVFAVDAATGQERWHFSTGQYWDMPSAPALVGGRVYFGSKHADGHLYALDALTGQPHWRVSLGEPATSAPAVVDGVLYVGTESGLRALDPATGEQRWALSSTTVFAGPTVAGGIAYVHAGGSGDSRGLYAVDVVTGARRWTCSLGPGWNESSQPTVADGTVYVGCASALHAVDAESGHHRWEFRTGHYVTSSPAVVDGLVYVGSWDTHLYALRGGTGELHWKFTTEGALPSAPICANGLVYIGSWDFSVYAVDAATGERRWSFTAGDWMDGLAVANELVYVGGRDGYLYALDAAVRHEWDEAEKPARRLGQTPRSTSSGS